MTDAWKPVVGYETLYEVSNNGRVRSLPRVGVTRRSNRSYGGTELKQQDFRGYRVVCLSDQMAGRKNVAARVHRLVIEAFAGPKPSGKEIRHLNGNKADNRVANLAYGTAKENAADRDKHGRTMAGERHWSAKLSAEDVQQIRSLYPTFTKTTLARIFGVTSENICAVVKRQTWRNI